MGELFLEALVGAALVVVAVATAFLFAARLRARARVGSVIASEVEQVSAYRIAAILLLAVALVVTVLHPTSSQLLLVALLLLATLNVALAPTPDDAVCGDTGVRRGWYSRTFADLEEWRLTGDHLRFRLFGVWTSAPLPRPRQAPVRETLERLAGDRESALRD